MNNSKLKGQYQAINTWISKSSIAESSFHTINGRSTSNCRDTIVIESGGIQEDYIINEQRRLLEEDLKKTVRVSKDFPPSLYNTVGGCYYNA